MTTQPAKFADNVMQWLSELGYTHCFFVAGGNIMHLLDGARTRMTCIPVVHEVAAGIAVEYFNESNGTSRAFALVTAGPGVTNILTAMGGAWLESRELLVLAGQVKTSDLATDGIRQRGIQEIDGVALAKPVAKISRCITAPISAKEFTDAVLEGRRNRPGPVFLEFCLDAQGAPTQNLDLGSIANVDTYVGPAAALLKTAESAAPSIIERLKSAQRPVLLIGGGVTRDVASRNQRQLREVNIPLMTTWNGTDRLDSHAQNYFGRPNTWGQRHANIILSQADLIVALGTRLGLQQTGFNWQAFGKGAFIVHVDVDRSELTKGHPRTDLAVHADANTILEAMLDQKYDERVEWFDYCKEITQRYPLNDAANETGGNFVSPYDFYADLSSLARADDIIVPCSSGGANSVSMQVIQQKYGQVVITDKGLASMGYGLSGAIGAAMAHPGRRTWLVEGDGGFSQNLQELATVEVNRLPIKTFVFANEGYGSIRMTQKNYFGGAYLGCDTQTGLGFPDWHQLFGAYGIPCMTVRQNWASNSDVTALLASDGPAAFIVPIDPLQTYWPKITSRITETGSMESNPLHLMTPDLTPEEQTKVFRYVQH
jgi:acetolactate synthase-1/2/3 large subunit